MALLVAACVAVAGCSGAGRPLLAPGGAGVADLNTHPRGAVRDGGELRWPLDSLPANLNVNQVDGATADGARVVGALLPRLFRAEEDGRLVRDPDFLSSADVTSTAPQEITYRINSRAVWSNGQPITWRDFESQWKALDGRDPAYRVASTTGYSDIASVRAGQDNQQVVVTFTRPFAEWRSLFSPLYPISTNSDPVEFNTGWVRAAPTTAGPFGVDSLDPVRGTVTLGRGKRWWGTPAKLDRIVFQVVDRAARPDALADGRLDFYPIGSDPDLLRRAQTIPGVAVRQSPERTYNQLTFNGAAGAILSDAGLRRAVAHGIDRLDLTRRMIGAITPDVVVLGNNLYAYGSRDYRDHSDLLRYDPGEAERELDGLGWTRASDGAVRTRGGIPLRLRLVEPRPNPVGERIDRVLVDQLARIGVQVVVQPVPLAGATAAYRRGDFDLAGFAWQNSATPFSGSVALYAEPEGADPGQNYGRIHDPAIDALFAKGLRELDDTKRAEIGNRIDRLTWQEVHHLPLYPATGAYAVRSTLANFGAPGFADIDYVDAGYLR
ncbi:MAG TPA: ABC transporter family substrate-binding protein [Pseudonocardia sp.]